MNSDQHVADAAQSAAEVSPPLPAENGVATIRRPGAELYAQAAAARTHARLLAAHLRAARLVTAETFRLIDEAWDATRLVRERRSEVSALRLQYSVTARLQARLASMPVIEQAKGIVMAQSGLPEEQAFDALRRASQRENIKMRDLATRIVAQAVYQGADGRQAGPASAAAPAADEVTHARTVSAIANAAARRRAGRAAG